MFQGSRKRRAHQVDAHRVHAAVQQFVLQGLDVGRTQPLQIYVSQGAGQVVVDDAAVAVLGSLTQMSLDAIGHPSVQPVTHQDALGGRYDAAVKLGEQLAQPLIGLFLGSFDRGVTADALAVRVAAEVYR